MSEFSYVWARGIPVSAILAGSLGGALVAVLPYLDISTLWW